MNLKEIANLSANHFEGAPVCQLNLNTPSRNTSDGWHPFRSTEVQIGTAVRTVFLWADLRLHVHVESEPPFVAGGGLGTPLHHTYSEPDLILSHITTRAYKAGRGRSFRLQDNLPIPRRRCTSVALSAMHQA
jgi:hypothetical protein